MSVLENIQKLFKTKPDRPDGSMETFDMTDKSSVVSTTAGGWTVAGKVREQAQKQAHVGVS